MAEDGSPSYARWRSTAVCAAIALTVLLPNLLLFSTDDLDIYRKSGEAGIAVSQAGEGRYTFHLIGLILKTIGSDYNSYLIVSIALFSASLAVLFRVVMSISSVDMSAGYVLGYGIFLTSGLNLDLFQYDFAYMQYGVAYLCAGGILGAIHWIRSRPGSIAAASVLGAAGMGAYQLLAHIVLMAILAIGMAACIDSRVSGLRRMRDTILGSLLALAVGAMLYVVINAVLRAAGAAGFEHYPVRAQGLPFARANITAYGRTLLDLVSFSHPQYRPLLPKAWLLLFMGSLLYALARLWRRGVSLVAAGVPIIAAAVVCWPNPANLFLADYWPSARSMAGFALFFGTTCAVLFRDAGVDRRIAAVGRVVLVSVLACQVILMAIRYQDRWVQQIADVALAQTILLRADSEFPPGEPLAIDLAVAPGATQTAKPLVLDYGRSMFATAWSAPALLDYLSGHRVSARVVDTMDCPAGGGRLSFERRGDRLLVCLLGS